MDPNLFTDSERRAVVMESSRYDTAWQQKNRDALHDGALVYMPGGSVLKEMNDYLDRFGQVRSMFDDLASDRADDETAPMIRQELQTHLLAITLLLERCEGLEWKRVERVYIEKQAAATVS